MKLKLPLHRKGGSIRDAEDFSMTESEQDEIIRRVNAHDKLIAALSDPSKLLREAVWEKENNGESWDSMFGRYRVFETRDGWWWTLADGRSWLCRSLEAGKALVWIDYCERMLPALIGGSDA